MITRSFKNRLSSIQQSLVQNKFDNNNFNIHIAIIEYFKTRCCY